MQWITVTHTTSIDNSGNVEVYCDSDFRETLNKIFADTKKDFEYVVIHG